MSKTRDEQLSFIASAVIGVETERAGEQRSTPRARLAASRRPGLVLTRLALRFSATGSEQIRR